MRGRQFERQVLGERVPAGQQAQVPLLAGWNSQESGPGGVLGLHEGVCAFATAADTGRIDGSGHDSYA